MMREHGQFTDIPQISLFRTHCMFLKNMVRPGGFELPTFWFVARFERISLNLSGRILMAYTKDTVRTSERS
jgi:hypothetical protein